MKPLLVIVIALLLLVGAIVGALSLGGGRPTTVPGATVSGNPAFGKQVALRIGCAVCHSEDGAVQQGPSFKGLWGSVVKFDDGSTGLIDDTAVRDHLRDPTKKVMESFEPRMTVGLDAKLSEEDRVNLLAYLHSLGVQK